MADVHTGEVAVAATEAQIAVHWKEEDFLYPPPNSLARPISPTLGHGALQRKELPGMLPGIR